MIYTVTFNPALDYVMHAGAIANGKTNRSRGEELYFGGKGINVSYVLSQLGAPTTALGFVYRISNCLQYDANCRNVWRRHRE